MAAAEKAKSSDPAVWSEVRTALAAANRVDPDHPEPLILFYDSFRKQGVDPTENAVTGLEYAYALAPYDRGLRRLLADQLLVDGDAKEARAILSSVAYDPHEGPAGQAAARAIRKIDAGDMAAALKIWQATREKEEAANDGA
jgi:hypothetical protein